MFSARGFNIESLVVGRTEDPALSRMTIVVHGDDRLLEQVRKQLAKIITVVRVRDYKDLPFVERDLAMIKIAVPAGKLRYGTLPELQERLKVEEGALAATVAALERSPVAGVAVGMVVPFGDDPAAHALGGQSLVFLIQIKDAG